MGGGDDRSEPRRAPAGTALSGRRSGRHPRSSSILRRDGSSGDNLRMRSEGCRIRVEKVPGRLISFPATRIATRRPGGFPAVDARRAGLRWRGCLLAAAKSRVGTSVHAPGGRAALTTMSRGRGWGDSRESDWPRRRWWPGWPRALRPRLKPRRHGRRSNPAELRREVAELSLKLLEAEAQAAEIKEEQRLLDEEPLRGGDADAKPMAAAKGFWETALIPRGPSMKAQESSPLAVLAAMDAVRARSSRTEKVAIEAWKVGDGGATSRSRPRIVEAEELVGGPARSGGSAGRSPRPGRCWGCCPCWGALFLTAHESPGPAPMAAARPGQPPQPDRPGAGDPAGRRPRRIAGHHRRTRRAVRQGGLGRSPGAPAHRPGATAPGHAKEAHQANDGAAEAAPATGARLEDVRRARAAHALKPNDKSENRAVERIESIEAQVQEQFRTVRIAARLTARCRRRGPATREEAERRRDRARGRPSWAGVTTRPHRRAHPPRRLRPVHPGLGRADDARPDGGDAASARNRAGLPPLPQQGHAGLRRRRRPTPSKGLQARFRLKVCNSANTRSARTTSARTGSASRPSASRPAGRRTG